MLSRLSSASSIGRICHAPPRCSNLRARLALPHLAARPPEEFLRRRAAPARSAPAAGSKSRLMVRRRWWEEPEQIKRWKIFRGDRVEVLRGPGRGKQGVLRRLMAENKLVVQGINVQREFDFDEQTGEKKVVEREARSGTTTCQHRRPDRRVRTRTSGARERRARPRRQALGAVVPRVKHTASTRTRSGWSDRTARATRRARR